MGAIDLENGSEERLPRRLGRYVLLSRLTEGGMTEVYAARLAEEVGPGRVLVIKVLPRAVADDPEAELRFLSEARIVLNLTHGNITTAFEFSRDEAERPFLVMEYVPGPSLRRLLHAIRRTGKRLPIEDGLFVMAEVAKALSYAHNVKVATEHGHGIIHRDISPDNIVISTSGQVKLTDFGIAHFARAQSFGPVFGKPAYIAPEVARGAEPSVVSDIYSVGAVLFECIGGEPPFKGRDDKETLSLLKSEPVPPVYRDLVELPDELKRLVRSLLEKDPKERLQSATEMEVRLRGLLRECHPSYTESHLSNTISRYFSPDDFMDPTPRESLIKALVDAGVVVSGEESTDELLDNRTVPMPISSLPPPRSAPSPTSMRRKGMIAVASVGGLALSTLGVLVYLFHGSPRTGPVDHAQSSAENAVGEKDKASHTTVIEHPKADDRSAVEAVEKLPTPAKIAKMRKISKLSRQKARTVKSSTAKPKRSEAVEYGWLNINSYPWSYVSVDGRRLKGHTPYRRIKIPSGPHLLVFENPELNLKSQKRVIVTPWEEVNVGLRLGDHE